MKAELLDSFPPGSIEACHKVGRIQKESFTQCFEHFVRSVKLSKKGPVFQTLDGHYSHPWNIEVMHCVRENRVHIV